MNQLTAQEAADLLGVKRATLYAYVSRGLLPSAPGEGGRERTYRREDVEALLERRRGGSAAGALRWGEPVLDTSITEMTADGPRYRGHLAVELAEADTPFEAVAELLWTGRLSDTPWPPLEPPLDVRRLSPLVPSGAPLSTANQLAVTSLGARDWGRFDTRQDAVLPRARALVRTLAASLALPFDPSRAEAASAAPTIAEALAVAFGVRPRRAVLRALDRALVVMADHELNASTFAARVVASTRADVYAAVLAGLATLSGPLHGAASDRVEALLAEIERPEDAARVVQERDRRGERVPGFGHPFYPAGDPRAPVLFDGAYEVRLRAPELRRLSALVEAMVAAGRPAPNVDVGIVALRAALGLPRGAGAGIFAVSRCAGWLAHVLEQYESGFLMRPRARFRPSAS